MSSPRPRPLERGLERLLDALFPQACAACDTLLARTARGSPPFCPPCRAALRPAGAGTCDRLPVFSAGRHAAPLREAIVRLKYRGRGDLGVPLGRWLAAAVPAELWARKPLVVPVPLHPRRLAERGFNQAALLARALARAAGCPVAPDALKRTGWEKRQVGLGREDRRQNVSGCFQVRRPHRVEGREIVLVDDVFTTGATARECVSVLAQFAAVPVAIVALASAEAPHSTLDGATTSAVAIP